MKFSIAKSELTGILNIVLKGMASRSTLPILSGILVEAADDKVTFQTTDLEISIKHVAAANVLETGRAVLPGKLFADIVKSLPDAAVTVTSYPERAEITCMESSFTLSTLNASDFPYFPEVAADQTVAFPSAGLARVVKRVSSAVSRDESRVVLTGIELSLEGNNARFIATDSYRLAVANMTVEGQEFEPFTAVVPGKIFEDVSKLAVSGEQVSVGFTENQIVFEFGSTVLVSRKIEGKYPNCMQLIPSSHAASVRIDTSALVTAIKRVSLLAQAHAPIHFAFSEGDQDCTVSARTADVGDAKETVNAQVEGDDIEISFSHQYILDGLASVEGEAVIELQDSFKPGIIKQVGDDSFLYLAMPRRRN